ncbi:metal dependent phosphohydrolase [Ruminiclostridium papyrosolvens DSM 2782]|uniref:Metal dependent phosphohydrolase n=1 Tax=Ruminiclostridium papyrosolvens DSM 2782 TaxID=588581 RepID=F1T9S8_9FIRM|nr:5'-deoxynucleotidase [Ruminiclostridium papyrosolvens]EGD48670.1 metal dependent phosphohydrolase [Ruminiclostridium papyrosolvens DSM 2782]WES32572.1 5'-deoxynucleotidase [Ruminiclostridium papyrosolvens DSM 2782]
MDDKSFHFFAFLSRMKYINRWGLMRNTYTENIQEHSLQVSIIAHGLAVIKNTYFNGEVNPERVAILAMFHDCNEIITGDMPTPIKYYNPQISKIYKDIEDISKEKIISMLPEEMADEYYSLFFKNPDDMKCWKLVKAADRISAYIKCVEEVKVGNNEFKKARETILQSILEIDLPEVGYFMEKFIPSFNLSLDEID